MSQKQKKKSASIPKPGPPRKAAFKAENSGIDVTKRLKTILDYTPILIAYLDSRFNFILVNKAFAAADKRAPSFYPGKNHFDLYPNKENERIFNRVVRTGKPYFAHAKAFEYAEHPERGVSYWDWSLIPDKDKKGKVLGLVLSLSDVTSRVKMEQERFRLSRAVEQSPVSVVITDPEGKIEYVNPKFAQLTGFSRKEAVGRKPSLLKSGLHPPEFYEDLWGKIKRGKDWKGEFCNRKKNGELYWESALISPIQDEAGRLVHIIGIKEDITQRKRTEEELNRYKKNLEALVEDRTEILKNKIKELRRAEKRLSDAEMQYKTVADFTYDWEYWKMPDGSFRYISPSVERISGFKAEEFIDNPNLFLELVHPEDRTLWEQHDTDMHQTRSHGEIQFRIKNRKGEIRWIHHVCHPVVDGAGHYLGLRATNRDITAQREAEEKVRCHLQELSHMSRLTTIGELTAALAHQLNQPLAAILSNAQAGKRFLRAGSFDANEMKDILSAIIAEDLRASDIIKGLRNLLKKEEVPMASVDIIDIIQESVSIMKNEANAKNISLKLDLDSGRPLVLGSRIQLQQVVLNLMVNSFDAVLQKDSGPREIAIRTSREETKMIRVDIEDSGSGIEDDILDRVFEPFYTTKPWGMGMGLAINKKIVENHGGKIWARNVSRGGAVISFTLPAAR
jgi:PAS domain S-box-containing protein